MAALIIYGDPDFFLPTILMGGYITDAAQDDPVRRKVFIPPAFQMFMDRHGSGQSGMFGPGSRKGRVNIIKGQEFVQTLHNSLVSNF